MELQDKILEQELDDKISLKTVEAVNAEQISFVSN